MTQGVIFRGVNVHYDNGDADRLDNTNADVLSRQAWDEDIYIAPDREGVGTERDDFSPEEGEGSVGREPSSN